MEQELTLHLDEDGVATLTFNRPQVKNAIAPHTVELFGAALTTLESAQGLRAVVVTGGGGAFVSGGDLKLLMSMHDEASGRAFCGAMTSHLARLEQLPVPVIAAIEGVALGGGMEIALACDLRVASSSALLSFRQVRMGLSPGWGGALRLLERVGRQRAQRLLWEGEDLTAQRAREEGLVDEVCPEGEALSHARRWAGRLAAQAPLAVRTVKEMMLGTRGWDRARASAHEAERFLELWVSADHAEAVAAFMERRPPRWSGR